MRNLILALFFLPLVITAPRASAKNAAHWVQLRTDHFVIITDTNEKEARKLGSQFERMRTVFHIMLPDANADAIAPITVLALKDRKGFQSLIPSAYLAKDALNLSGFFLTADDKNYILLRLDTEDEHPFSTVYHEYTHFMVRRMAFLPLWLNEGFAEFFENTDINEKNVQLGQPSANDILFLRQNSLIPLPTLFAVDHNSPYYHDEQKGSIFYAQSWALVHFLIVTDHDAHKDRLRDYSELLAHGQDPVTAAQNAFGNLKQLQSALEGYVRGADYKMFNLARAITVDESTFKLQPITTSDADAARADVLFLNQRGKDAEALLTAVLQADPKNALAHETMGYMRFRDHDNAGAIKWYGEAIDLGSQSYLANYYYGVLSLDGNDDHPEAVEKSLIHATQLNPSFAPAYDALAVFYIRHNEKLDAAHLAEVKAVQLEPDNIRYRLNAAAVFQNQQNIDSALAVLHGALKVARDRMDVGMINNQIQSLESFQNAMQGHNNASGEPANNTMISLDTDAPSSSDELPKYPDGPPTGAHHTVRGVLHGVKCSYPTVITVTLDGAGKPLTLYNNNMYKIAFSTANYTAPGDVDPCNAIDGMKAEIVYADVTDKNVAGQIISIQLSK